MSVKKGNLNRAISLLLSLLLIIGLCMVLIPPVAASANGDQAAQLTGEDVRANAGDEGVQMEISIADCPDFFGMVLRVFYNKSALNLVDIIRGPATSATEGSFGGNIVDSKDGFGTVIITADPYGPLYMSADDDVLFTLVFDVAENAGSGDYVITLEVDDREGWNFIDSDDQPLPMDITNGTITVTGSKVAEYDGNEYETLQGALAAAIADTSGTVKLLSDLTIENYADRIIIPANKVITLDMNGHTITSEVPKASNTFNCTVEVQKNGALSIMDNSAEKGGKFIHTTGEDYTRCLVNSGTLNMSDVDAYNFYCIICDGSSATGGTGAGPGIYGAIENCKLIGTSNAFEVGAGQVDTIKGCILEAGSGVLMLDGGLINNFEDSIITSVICDNNTGLSIRNAVVENIKDCTIGELGGPEYPFVLWSGSVGNISGGSYRDVYIAEGAEIDSISGGTFIGEATIYNEGTINTISGGEFSCESGCPVLNYSIGGGIGTISGGTFTSNDSCGLLNYNSTIGEISGGIFSSEESCGLNNSNGTIETISGGVFSGNTAAIELSGAEGCPAAINSVEGGYYKTATNSNWIVVEDGSTCTSPEGYNLSTVPMRPSDFDGKEGYYHFGQTADITWVVEGQDPITDQFVIGDPVYYNYDGPTKEGDEGDEYRFKGWNDGVNQYRPGQSLPVALEGGVTYTAVFEQIGSEEDYQVYLETEVENINAGEEFTVDVIVSSEGNENFYGATVVIGYDKDKVEFDDANTIYGSGFNSYADGNTETTRGISGGQEAGYALNDGSYKIASIGFKAKTNIGSGKTEAIFSIEDNPVVDQQMGFASIGVEKGEDITVNLYNLTVTFTTGENITMGDVIAYVRYDEKGLYADNDYEETFVEPSPEVADHYTFKGWKLGNEYFSFEDIKDMTFTENTTFVATATPGGYTIDLPDCVEIISGVEDDQIIIHGTDVVFTVTAAEGYQVNKVTYTVGEGEAEEIELVDGKYTIPGEKVTGNITVNVTQHIAGSIEFIAGQEFNSLPADHQLLVLTVADKLDGSAYEYNEDSMFYSSKYSEDGEQVYLYIVPNDVTEAEAREAIQITEGPTCYELRYDGDINLDGKVISTDAVIVFALYQGLWEDKSFPVTSKENMQARLEADVNGDKVVDTTDAQKILDIIWGNLD